MFVIAGDNCDNTGVTFELGQSPCVFAIFRPATAGRSRGNANGVVKIAPASLPGEVLVARKERGESVARRRATWGFESAPPTPKEVVASKVFALSRNVA